MIPFSHEKSAKKVFMIFLLLMCLLCFGGMRSVHAAKNVTLTKGQTRQLQRKASKWKSSKKSVASVSSTGLVTAKKKGTCRITAKSGGRTYTYIVKVESPKLNKTRKSLSVGKTFKLKVTGSTKNIRWSVSDSSVLKLKKLSTYRVQIKGLRDGTATVSASKGDYFSISCEVKVGTGVLASADEPAQVQVYQTLYLNGDVFKELTSERTDTAVYVSSVSGYGQSAPLYIHKDGGDGLENIWAADNNGAVGVAGAQLSADAVAGTIAKACLWARAVADSPYHGYDFGWSYPGAQLMYTFGQAKPGSPGTGDYCCSTIPLCAYYFAGVNVIGENLGGPDAKYIPDSTLLFYNQAITYYLGGTLKGFANNYRSNYEWEIFSACGFTDVVSEYSADPDNFVFRAGDVVTANGHSQLVLTDGTYKTAETVQAYGPDKTGSMPAGGDQSGSEIGRAYYVRRKPTIRHIMRFTGEGVQLNTSGLTG